MRSTKLFCLALVILTTAGITVNGQIVNIETSRMQSDTVGWMGGGGLAVSLTQNTQQIFGGEAEVHLQYKTSRDMGLWLILADFNYLKVGKDEVVSNQFLHLRYNYKLSEHIRWEVFGQFQNNAVTQIDSRFLVGTGPRFKLVKNSKFRLYAASLVMFEREKESTTPKINHNDLRSSSYISFTWTPTATFEVISTSFFQPLFKKFSDYRILNQLVLKSKISRHFGLSVKWNYLHDRFPAGTSPRTTYNLSTGIDFSL
ncbi:MAG: DUF481 domain-containing protein [Chitinophagaceae bacterium]|nr:DUF481 domain-containing protein [Chitinophagaceae bacterium]